MNSRIDSDRPDTISQILAIAAVGFTMLCIIFTAWLYAVTPGAVPQAKPSVKLELVVPSVRPALQEAIDKALAGGKERQR